MEPRSRLKKQKNKCFNLLLLGYVALVGVSVLLGLSSLEAGNSRAADRLSDDREGWFPAGGRSPPARQGHWVWRAAGERGGHLPSLLRRKRQAGEEPSSPTAKATASAAPLAVAFSTTVGSSSPEADSPAPQLLNCPHCDKATKVSSVTGPQIVSVGGPDAARTRPSTAAPTLQTSTHGPGEAETTLSASPASGSAAVLGASKGQKETSSALPRALQTSTPTVAMEAPVDNTDTTEPSDLVAEATLSASTASEGNGSAAVLGGKKSKKETSTLPPGARASVSTEDPVDNTDTTELLDLVAEATLSASTASEGNGSAAVLGGKKSKKETSTLPPGARASVSTEDPVDNTDTTEPLDLVAEGEPGSSHPTFRAGGFGTTQAAVEMSHSPTEKLMWKCLLGILILAFVAATFIVCAIVLAAMLWRQKHAYQRLRHSNTEMVCISSLLPDGEQGANGGRPVPARRMRRFPDNCSEAEGDNLTLSSFLPDH